MYFVMLYCFYFICCVYECVPRLIPSLRLRTYECCTIILLSFFESVLRVFIFVFLPLANSNNCLRPPSSRTSGWNEPRFVFFFTFRERWFIGFTKIAVCTVARLEIFYFYIKSLLINRSESHSVDDVFILN